MNYDAWYDTRYLFTCETGYKLMPSKQPKLVCGSMAVAGNRITGIGYFSNLFVREYIENDTYKICDVQILLLLQREIS